MRGETRTGEAMKGKVSANLILESCQRLHDSGLGPRCHAQALTDLTRANTRITELENALDKMNERLRLEWATAQKDTARRCAEIVDCPHDGDGDWDRCRRNQANAIRREFGLPEDN